MNGNTFLYNTGPIDTLADPDWNVRQTYTVTRFDDGQVEGDRKGHSVDARQHRPPLDAELRGRSRRRPSPS